MTTATTMPDTMSPAQRAYALAKAYYETQTARYNERTDGLTSEGEADNPYVDGTPARAAYLDCDMDAAWEQLRLAENCMIEWAGQAIQRAKPAQFHQIAHLFADSGRAALMQGMKQQLVDICFRFHSEVR